jgi:hypothetical protein
MNSVRLYGTGNQQIYDEPVLLVGLGAKLVCMKSAGRKWYAMRTTSLSSNKFETTTQIPGDDHG